MIEQSKPVRTAKRKEPKQGEAGKTKAVAVDEVAYAQVAAQSKKLKLTKGEYASAAIAFFAESGLNPTKERPEGLATLATKLAREGLEGRMQTVDVGNRLIQIIKAWEKALYGFLQMQQAATLNYLELIENNLLQQQVALEANFFSPMMEQMVKNNVEAYMGRVVGEKTNLQVRSIKPEEWPAANKRLNEQRDQEVVTQMREYIKNNRMPIPAPSPKPQVVPRPVAPPKAPAAAPAAGTPAPK